MKGAILVMIGAFLMLAGCQNSELQQCQQENQQLQAKVTDLESQIVEEQDVSMRMLGDFLNEGSKTVKELNALKVEMSVKEQQIAALQKQIADLNANQQENQKTIDSLNEQLKAAGADKKAALDQIEALMQKEKSAPQPAAQPASEPAPAP